MLICNWINFDAELARLKSSIKNNKPSSDPFAFVASFLHPRRSSSNAPSYGSRKSAARPRLLFGQGQRHQHDRIRIAYVSSDLRQHATSLLAAGMFEHHDKSRFEITAISIGPDDRSKMRERLKLSFDHFIDAASLSDGQIASRIKEAEIDILIDLHGFTNGERTNILAQRPAPILGELSGLSGDWIAQIPIDYIFIADPTIIPEEDRKFYSEKIAVLPHTYQVNDRTRAISNEVFSRSDDRIAIARFRVLLFQQQLQNHASRV